VIDYLATLHVLASFDCFLILNYPSYFLSCLTRKIIEFQQQICNGHKLEECIPEVSGLESSTSSVPFLEGTPPPPPPAMFGSCEPCDAASSPVEEIDAPPPSYADTVKHVHHQHRGGGSFCSAHHSHDDCRESLESDYSDEVTKYRRYCDA
jgi:hypothetical protein